MLILDIPEIYRMVCCITMLGLKLTIKMAILNGFIDSDAQALMPLCLQKKYVIELEKYKMMSAVSRSSSRSSSSKASCATPPATPPSSANSVLLRPLQSASCIGEEEGESGGRRRTRTSSTKTSPPRVRRHTSTTASSSRW